MIARVVMESILSARSAGELRGLLCIRCNIAIGNLLDDPKIALQAFKYLGA